VNRQDDLVAEGEPEKEFNPGIAARLPRKTVAGGALIRDRAGRILFLEPTYKPTLDIPGGIAERDESPYDACRREVKEEIGLDREIGALLVVDWFLTLAEATPHLRPSMTRRLHLAQQALTTHAPSYADFGRTPVIL
jgi:8-oxo-dGTP pyrophosphatase MutT (NUDIX family)